MLRVVIVDDEERLRRLLREIVESAGFEVVGEAEDGADGARVVAELAPDVVTMDLEMPVRNGAEATAEICAAEQHPVVVIVSGSDSSELVGRALAAGARWHVAKKDAVDQLPVVLEALRD